MSDEANEMLPPRNLDAERSVLGSMLRENEAISRVVLLLRAESFYLDAHRKIFAAILHLHEPGGRPVDGVLLAEELTARNELEDVGRAAAIAELWNAAPTAANVDYHARIVRDKALRRALILAGTEVVRDAYHDLASAADDVVAEAERKVLAVAQRGADAQTFTLASTLPEVMRRIDERVQRGRGLAGLSTGFLELDNLTAGWHAGELIVVAARPSVGKTALALAFVRHVLRSQSDGVFFASLEQSRWELGERMLCAESGVQGQALRRGLLRGEDFERLAQAREALHSLALHIDDASDQTALRIASQARRLHQRAGLALVVVDYLQLIAPESRKETRNEQVGGCARRLKGLAKELQKPVIALAQLNREVESRPDPKPRLSDLRDSGEVEQHADVVVLLHKPKDNPDHLELLLRKQRNGPTGEMTLLYRRDTFRFEDYLSAAPDHPFR